jgi:hypothetical protein
MTHTNENRVWVRCPFCGGHGAYRSADYGGYGTYQDVGGYDGRGEPCYECGGRGGRWVEVQPEDAPEQGEVVRQESLQ